uniref:Uncharacterized protein n=1 Tax=Cyprinus carpio TaxID=7962 RepID=A0A8C2IJZ0_CYPCA
PAGKVTDEPSSNIDIFPMVLNLSGASIPSDRVIDGHDLFPLLQGQVGRSEHEFIFPVFPGDAIWKVFFFTSISTQRTALPASTLISASASSHDPPLLYDLSRDPSEILEVIRAAVSCHSQTWKPWLQLCCSSLSQLCTCERDHQIEKL